MLWRQGIPRTPETQSGYNATLSLDRAVLAGDSREASRSPVCRPLECGHSVPAAADCEKFHFSPNLLCPESLASRWFPPFPTFSTVAPDRPPYTPRAVNGLSSLRTWTGQGATSSPAVDGAPDPNRCSASRARRGNVALANARQPLLGESPFSRQLSPGMPASSTHNMKIAGCAVGVAQPACRQGRAYKDCGACYRVAWPPASRCQAAEPWGSARESLPGQTLIAYVAPSTRNVGGVGPWTCCRMHRNCGPACLRCIGEAPQGPVHRRPGVALQLLGADNSCNAWFRTNHQRGADSSCVVLDWPGLRLLSILGRWPQQPSLPPPTCCLHLHVQD